MQITIQAYNRPHRLIFRLSEEIPNDWFMFYIPTYPEYLENYFPNKEIPTELETVFDIWEKIHSIKDVEGVIMDHFKIVVEKSKYIREWSTILPTVIFIIATSATENDIIEIKNHIHLYPNEISEIECILKKANKQLKWIKDNQ
ncbi:MAG: hypothetical protein AAF611_07805 [Bacteroidota bacterium]